MKPFSAQFNWNQETSPCLDADQCAEIIVILLIIAICLVGLMVAFSLYIYYSRKYHRLLFSIYTVAAQIQERNRRAAGNCTTLTPPAPPHNPPPYCSRSPSVSNLRLINSPESPRSLLFSPPNTLDFPETPENSGDVSPTVSFISSTSAVFSRRNSPPFYD